MRVLDYLRLSLCYLGFSLIYGIGFLGLIIVTIIATGVWFIAQPFVWLGRAWRVCRG